MGIFGGTTKKMEPVQEETESRDLPPLPEPPSASVIAEGVTVSGNLRGDGIVQVEGIVEGEVSLKGLVSVAPCGTVKGPVAADTVHVSGLIQGDITAHDQVRLEKTGIISGDIKTASFVIEEGGWLNGRTTMEKPKR